MRLADSLRTGVRGNESFASRSGAWLKPSAYVTHKYKTLGSVALFCHFRDDGGERCHDNLSGERGGLLGRACCQYVDFCRRESRLR